MVPKHIFELNFFEIKFEITVAFFSKLQATNFLKLPSSRNYRCVEITVFKITVFEITLLCPLNEVEIIYQISIISRRLNLSTKMSQPGISTIKKFKSLEGTKLIV